MMNTFAKKIYIEPDRPDPADLRSDKDRILDALKPLKVHMSLPALRSLHPLLAEADYKVTITLAPGAVDYDIIRVEAGDQTEKVYGAALDVGSTTLQLEILELNSGKCLASAGCVNSQSSFGLEILSRIIAVKENRENLNKLRDLVIEDTENLLNQCCRQAGIEREDIAALIVAGNTTMIHLFTACDPWHVFQNPYTPVFYDPGIFPARELGIRLDCNVLFTPAVANYLGGDITSGLLLTDILDSEEPVLFFDIGTNGELAIGCKDFLLVGAGAAGPALEGEVSKSGMKAVPGAVSDIHIDEKGGLHYETIDDLPPKGICGSGILELIAEGYLSGWIEGNCAINTDASPYIDMVWLEESQQSVPAIFYTGEMNSQLYFTQNDIKEYISCKAAAFTMVATMLDVCGMGVEDIKTFYLAGGFGTHYDLESAITVGMYPDVPRDRFCIMGNSSLGGAKALLLDADKMKTLEQIREKAVYIQYGEQAKFLENMIAAQFIPHTDLNAFPNVIEKRRQRCNK